MTRHNARGIALFLATFIVLSLPGRTAAQESLRTQLFSGVDSLLSGAKEHKADILAPASFKKGMGYYNRATEDYKKGGQLEDINENAGNASVYFAKSLDVAKMAEAAFSAPLAARADALSAAAPTQQTKLWTLAEEKFHRAVVGLEDGDISAGTKYGGEAAEMYRTAELEAIKSNYLTPARVLLEKGKKLGVDETAPKSYAKALQLTARVEEFLTQNRYDTDEAREMAQEARYEADHALAIHEAIGRMKIDEKNFETHLLRLEEQFAKVSTALGLKARFDRGFEPPANEAVEAVKKRDTALATATEKLEKATADLNASTIEAENLRQQIGSMEKRVGSLTDNEKDLQAKLATHRSQESTIREVEKMFTADEGHVLREGTRVVIRLYGLSFPVGTNTIEPQYYSLLTKVQEAIRLFPKAGVTIEGHTDAAGTDEVNQKLSESRSLAVAEYLMANMGVELPVVSQGFGESRPVASNETPEGRAKNRRIDVVITPVW
jgi:outer membrane protein OmpA-like peptidoglycan-associated protein